MKSKLTNQSLNSIYDDSVCHVFLARRDTVGWIGKDKISLRNFFCQTDFVQKITLNNILIKYFSIVLNWGKSGRKLMFVLCQWNDNNIILASKYFSEIQPKEMIQSYFNKAESEDQTMGKSTELISSASRHISIIIAQILLQEINGDFLQVEAFIVSTSFYNQTVNLPHEEICNINSILDLSFFLLKECDIC